MLIGLATLISILLFGGAGELFYVDNLEKGIKKYVEEKDRKKEILTDLKNAKSIFKDFEKNRKADYKIFHNLYAEKNTSTEQLNSFFEDLVTKRTNFQAQIIDQRILIFKKIKAEEWDNIVQSSGSMAEKRVAKIKKKTAKKDVYFSKTRAQIESHIKNEKNKQRLLAAIDNVNNSAKALESILLTINTSHNKILADKNSGKTELLEIVTEDSKNRNPLFDSMVNFHRIANDNCSDDEWHKIMKSFTKEMEMSSR
jgi:hypothetical protein